MDEFYLFLIIGLLIMGTLMIAFLLDISGLFGEGPSPREVLTTKAMRFSFESSSLRSQRSQPIGTLQLQNGLMFGSRDYAFNLTTEDLEDLTVNLNVRQTNNYGKLALLVNDNVIVNERMLPGEYSFPIDRSLFNGHAIIEMQSQSSGWRIWAPTVYDVDASLEYVVFSRRTDEFTFTLGDEADTLQAASVDFILSKNIGTLTVYVNGAPVFSGRADRLQQIDIDPALVKKGKNAVTLVAADDSYYLGEGSVAISYNEISVSE